MKTLKRIGVLLMVSIMSLGALFGGVACSNNEFTITVFSDVHHGDNDYNDFKCTKGLERLQNIINETPNSEFYINLGDAADHLVDGIRLYSEFDAKLKENNVISYAPNKTLKEGQRFVLNQMGNHEAAYMKKSDLAEYVPYVDGVGSVYSYTYKGVLFLAIDALYSAETGTDDCETIRLTQPPKKYIIPNSVIDWAKNETKNAIEKDNSIKGIVWLSHVAFKVIENKSRFGLIWALNEFDLPLTILEGHTHVEAYDDWYDDDNPEKKIAKIFTLPAVTTGDEYKYYNVTFKDGEIKDIEKNFESTVSWKEE